jgi:hypothetical protein
VVAGLHREVRTGVLYAMVSLQRRHPMVAAGATGANSGVRWVIDTRASQFTVQAFASGLVSVIAHSPKIAIRDWTGWLPATWKTPC